MQSEEQIPHIKILRSIIHDVFQQHQRCYIGELKFTELFLERQVVEHCSRHDRCKLSSKHEGSTEMNNYRSSRSDSSQRSVSFAETGVEEDSPLSPPAAADDDDDGFHDHQLSPRVELLVDDPEVAELTRSPSTLSVGPSSGPVGGKRIAVGRTLTAGLEAHRSQSHGLAEMPHDSGTLAHWSVKLATSDRGFATHALEHEEREEKAHRRSIVSEGFARLVGKEMSRCTSQLRSVLDSHLKEDLPCMTTCFSRVQRMRLPEKISAKAQNIVDTRMFSTTITMCILLNATIMALDADNFFDRTYTKYSLAVQGVDVQLEVSPAWSYVSDIAFAIIFSVELFLRIAAEESHFILGEFWFWNILDAFVVLASWTEIASANRGSDGTGSSMPPLRLIRVLRMLRSLRVIRAFRFFMELRLVLLSLLHSFWPLLWCFLVLCIIMFMFAMFFMQSIGLSIVQHSSSNDLADNNWVSILYPKFGTFTDAILTLFSAISGGENWMILHGTLASVDENIARVYVVYIVLMVLGVLNVITAVFVESALSKAKGDQRITIEEEQAKESQVAQELIREFRSIDVTRSACITVQDWNRFVGSEDGQDFLKLFNVNMHQSEEVFKLLDIDESGQIDIEEFVAGFMQIHGAVTRLDVQHLIRNNKRLLRKCVEHIDNVATDVQRLCNRFARVESTILQTARNKRNQSNMPTQLRADLDSLASDSRRIAFEEPEPLSTSSEEGKSLMQSPAESQDLARVKFMSSI